MDLSDIDCRYEKEASISREMQPLLTFDDLWYPYAHFIEVKFVWCLRPKADKSHELGRFF